MNLNFTCKNYISAIKTCFIFIFTLLLCIGILVFSNASSNGAKDGLYFCADILIPSLFPFMVLSAFIVKSGLCFKLSRFFNFATRLLFKLPGICGPTILLSLIGGYPTGARGIKSLFESELISKSEAEKMSYFAVGAGPCFVITVVGAGLLKSFKAGIILFFSQIISSIIIGIIVSILFKNKDDIIVNKSFFGLKTNIPKAIVESCVDSINGMINMCAFVILFSSFISIINKSGINETIIKSLVFLKIPINIAKPFLSIFLEVTNGCVIATNCGYLFEVISFALGWAGICVHFQIFSSLNSIPFSTLKFIFIRFIHGIIAAIITHIWVTLYPITISTFFSTNNSLFYSTHSNYFALIVLILSCICLLVTFTPEHIDLSTKKC